GAAARDGRAAQALVGRAQVELGPARARERPFLLAPLDESLAGVADLEHDLRLRLPPGLLALQEVAEELLLKRHAVVRVEVGPVLDAVHLEPLLLRRRAHEPAEDAAVVTEVAIVIGGALPDADRGEMRRLERRDLPLVHRVVGNPVQPDLAVAPWLGGRPLDAVIEILGLARRPDVEVARR